MAFPERGCGSRFRPGLACPNILHVLGTQQPAESLDQLLIRGNPDPSGPGPQPLSIPVAPFNIERSRARVSGAERYGFLDSLGGRGFRCLPAQRHAEGPAGYELIERPRQFYDERCPFLPAIPGAVAAGEQHRQIVTDHLVEPGPRASAVPWKSSRVIRAYSFPVFLEICRFTRVMTAATVT